MYSTWLAIGVKVTTWPETEAVNFEVVTSSLVVPLLIHNRAFVAVGASAPRVTTILPAVPFATVGAFAGGVVSAK